jgi:hypothetical protein
MPQEELTLRLTTEVTVRVSRGVEKHTAVPQGVAKFDRSDATLRYPTQRTLLRVVLGG